MKLVAIVGTNAEKSYNRELLQYMQRHFSSSVTIDVAEIDNIPLFKETMALPQAIQALTDQISAADGVIIGVPEYDHAVPAALKSVIEWLSCNVHPFNDKPVMIVGTSLGIQGTSRAQDELRQILNAPGVGAIVLPGNEFMLSFAPKAFDDQGALTDAHTVSFLESCFQHFIKLIKMQSGTSSMAVKWQGHYDVIVLGFGGAGATAARFAADNGARVLVVEAAPYGREGGNTRYSAQHVVMGESLDDLTTYYHALNAPFVTPEKTLQAYLSGMSRIPAYFKDYLGIPAVSWKHDIKPGDAVAIKKTMAEYPELPGSQTVDFALVHKRDKDAGLWKVLRQKVLDRTDQIDVWLDSRARQLIQEPTTGIVRGVQIERHGQLVNVHAKNGVVLAMGGFENNPELVQTYLHSAKLTPLGTLFNRGDGIKMAQAVGAKMWHMTNYESHGILPGITFKEVDGERGRQIEHWPLLKQGSILVTADDGTRYFPEDAPHRHGHIKTHGSWLIPMLNQHPYLVFDQAQYLDFKAQLAENGRLPYPQFMDKLISAKTLTELAAKMDVPADNLVKTVARFNQAKQMGEDLEFGRHVDSMRTFDDGPYYAIAAANDVLNTQGGPQRNEQAQILATSGQPIPHLFGAGELGGIVANCYQGGGNLAECLIFGKLAGEHAAADKADADDVTAAEMNGMNDLVDAENAANVTLGADQYLGRSNSGLGGQIMVRVTYRDQAIQKVEVVQHHESEDVGLVAIDQVPKEIVAANSTDVDAISGASASSRAIKEAVQDALKQVKVTQ
ncbi:NAD(P)H-dependent oxidoreductase [Lactiplantibacillus mudanjiangensis]|uniref:Urocanate reductase n=1 Tax=Lactiplantibacillus mudanjiangensis TaxID=1296538 RepID=A0A660DVB7_9LACO|nr:NAD(P)H-dependent oxidoreductase [Lactiplantibacillus mudanjiangensis]VDG23961.1 FAD-binding dehydrogenase [Lactobacillus sp.] [Lactiplantibacillus mudanjiangensis]VDG27142.1 FAD-binding dehydrogenase [Lactobacillus sp.] [Lactiplantibacillus mudanjiangensis]VDG33953.1 FAD-binding dehydrogenase [Lactobacillus sp.] [Lactiplantibacillus mudanjiangensis]